MEFITSIETDKDRFVTPTLEIQGFKEVQVYVPSLDDATNVTIEVAQQPHKWNYPACPNGFNQAGVIAEWRFDDADGTTIIDQVNSFTMTEQGDPTYAASAASAGLGNGVTFDGTGDAFDILTSSLPTDLVLPSYEHFSVEVVFSADNANTGDGDTLIACRNGAAGVGWQMNFDGNQYVDFDVDDGTETKLTGATDAATGSIVHALASITRNANGVLYINGSADDTTFVASRTGTVTPTAGASTRLSIGGDAARTAGDCFYGTIYFARIYNRALSADEAKDNHNIFTNNGYPGWTALIDPATGTDLVVSAAGQAPNSFNLTKYLNRGIRAIRARCADEQTTSATKLNFAWVCK